MKLGCIADDFTGATDLANNLVRAGMRSVADHRRAGRATAGGARRWWWRSSHPHHSGRRGGGASSLAVLRWLREHGAQQIYFKVCSTFDSTDRGNIGPGRGR